MSAIIALVLSAFPNALLGIMGKLVTEKFMQAVLEKVLIAGLEKAALLSTNTVDDDVVRMIKNRLAGEP